MNVRGWLGIVRSWPPAIRLLSGTLLMLIVSLLPLKSAAALAPPLLLTGAWIILCGFDGRKLGSLALAAMLLFLPLALYGVLSGTPWTACVIAWRGMLCLFVSVATCATIAPYEVREAVAFLPRTLAHLVVQLVIQSGMLAAEVRGISSALLLRGGGTRVLFGFPLVWLTRLLLRAERVAEAMEIRGFE